MPNGLGSRTISWPAGLAGPKLNVTVGACDTSDVLVRLHNIVEVLVCGVVNWVTLPIAKCVHQ